MLHTMITCKREIFFFLSFLPYRVDESQIRQIELETRQQSSARRWHQERKKRITASNFGSIMSLRKTTPCCNTVCRLRYYNENVSSKATRYGKKSEEKAIQLFEQDTGKKVTPSGLVIDSENNCLGASTGSEIFIVIHFSKFFQSIIITFALQKKIFLTHAVQVF